MGLPTWQAFSFPDSDPAGRAEASWNPAPARAVGDRRHARFRHARFRQDFLLSGMTESVGRHPGWLVRCQAGRGGLTRGPRAVWMYSSFQITAGELYGRSDQLAGLFDGRLANFVMTRSWGGEPARPHKWDVSRSKLMAGTWSLGWPVVEACRSEACRAWRVAYARV